MVSKWKHTTLGDIALSSNGAVDGPFGSNLPAAAYTDSGYPIIRGSNLSVGLDEFKDRDFVFVPEHMFQKLSRSECKAGDIIFTKKGTLGQTGLINTHHRFKQYLLSSNQMRLRVDPDKALPEYVYYCVSSQKAINKLIQDSECTGVPKINLAYLKSFPVLLPNLDEQKNIVDVLGSINKKITLNRRINQTLEQMAQALFKSWFVDFDPVIDNALDAGFFEQDLEFSDELLRRAEARKTVLESTDFKALPDAIRQMFPTAFEECAEPSFGLGGWVPEGWRPSNFGVEFDVTMGQSPPGSTYNDIGNGLPFFQGKTDFGFRFPSNRIYCTEPKRMAKKDDTLISVRAPVGDINLAAVDCAIGRGLAAARHKSGSISFSYYVLNSLSKYFEVFEGEGTVFGSINQKDFKALPLIKYPDEIITKFDEFCGNWDKRINNASVEISTLIDLRDTLLPRMISGELRLDEIEAKVAEVDLD